MKAQSITIPVSEPSEVGYVRRLATGLMSRLGLNETDTGHVAIVVTELANNLVRHGGGGQLVLRPLASPTVAGLEVLSIDRGCGMWSVERCMEDGYSTVGTAGTGMGAVQRFSSAFDVYSRSDAGTVVLSRLRFSRPESTRGPLQVGVVSVPKDGEDVCGDAWSVLGTSRRAVVSVADGLGHGASASIAAQEAMRILHTCEDSPPTEILDAAHAALRSTRGAAQAVAVLDLDQREIRFAGVGNVAALIVEPDGTSRNLVSHNGTIGHHLRKLQEFTYSWPPGALLVMHSDGLGTQWRLDRYPGLFKHHASLIAAVLYRDFNRGRDDVTVLVAREPDAPEAA